MFAIIRSGSKQYKIEPGKKIKIEKIKGEKGEEIFFEDVLLVADKEEKNGEIKNLKIGKPTVEGARVSGVITAQSRAKKIIVFRYKAKKRQEKKKGHRQYYTEVKIGKISV